MKTIKMFMIWVILFLMLSLAVTLRWLYVQNNKVNALETIGNTVMTDELTLSMNQIGEFRNSKDQVLLGNLYSELFTMENQAYRLSNYLHDSKYEIPSGPDDPVSPSSQLDQLMRMHADPKLTQEYLDNMNNIMKNFIASGKLSSIDSEKKMQQLVLFWRDMQIFANKFHEEHQLP